MKVCVIGSGISGLSCIHELILNNIEFDCFEKRNEIGGLWNYSEVYPSVYNSCQQNHPKESMGINDTKIEIGNSDYLTHTEYLSYLQKFKPEKIQFNKSVTSAFFDDELDCWNVVVDRKTIKYTHLIICTGHYSTPKKISISPNFSGDIIHSMDYKTPETFSNKDTLIIGGGSSAIQIACDLAYVAKSVSLLIRNMPFILPRYVENKTLLDFYRSVKHLPEEKIIEILHKHGVKQDEYKIPKPTQGLLTGTTIPISDEIFNLAKEEKIKFFSKINKINGNEITFIKEKKNIDSIILATGYEMKFPYLDFNVSHKDNIDFVINKKHKYLFFVGMLQPIGPIPPLLKVQSKMIIKIIKNKLVDIKGNDFSKANSHRVKLAEYVSHIEKKYKLI